MSTGDNIKPDADIAKWWELDALNAVNSVTAFYRGGVDPAVMAQVFGRWIGTVIAAAPAHMEAQLRQGAIRAMDQSIAVPCDPRRRVWTR